MSLFGAVASLPQAALSLINSHTKSHAVSQATAAKDSLKSFAAGAGTTTGATGTTAPSTAAQATTDIGSTFLSLLTKELQNQDPTAPMDSTAMVGQMISLNQLDQLIAINSALTPASTTPTTTTKPTAGVTAGASAGSAATLAATQALLAGANPSTPLSPAAQLSADSTLAAAAQSASNPATLNLSNFNSMFGGK